VYSHLDVSGIFHIILEEGIGLINPYISMPNHNLHGIELIVSNLEGATHPLHTPTHPLFKGVS